MPVSPLAPVVEPRDLAPRVYESGRAVGPKRVEWVSPTGDRIDLTGYAHGYGQGPDRTGLGIGPVDLKTDELTVGSTLRSINRPARTLSWVQHVFGNTQPEFDARWNRLLDAFNHDVDGQFVAGQLVVTHFDGRSRYVDAYYAGGLEGAESAGTWTGMYASAPVSLIALDPDFIGVDEVVAATVHGYTPRAFWPIWPLRLMPSQVFESIEVFNPGDRDAWPVITVTGPGSGVVVRNITTGKQVTFTRQLFAGETLVVDMAAKTAVDLEGESWRQFIPFPGSTFWSLPRGGSKLSVAMQGTTSASSVQVTFRPRYAKP